MMQNSWHSLDGGGVSRVDLLVCTSQKSDELPHTVKTRDVPHPTYRIVGISGNKMEVCSFSFSLFVHSLDFWKNAHDSLFTFSWNFNHHALHSAVPQFVLNTPIKEKTIYERCTRVFHQLRVIGKDSQNIYYGFNFLSSIEADHFYEEMCKAISETSISSTVASLVLLVLCSLISLSLSLAFSDKYPQQQTTVSSFKDSFNSSMPLAV